jgi:hypothetical protein
MDPIDHLEACVRRAATRLRLRRALQVGVFAGIGALALHTLGTAGSWLRDVLAGSGSAAGWPAWTLALLLVPLLAGALAAAWPIAELPLVRSLDRAHRLADLLASAWTFRALPPAQRTPFMRATLARAAQAIERADPARALEAQRPRGLGWLVGLGMTSLLLQLLPPQPTAARERAGELGARAGVRTRGSAAEGGIPAAREALLSADELASQRAALEEREPAGTESERVRAELERLLDRLERGTIDRIATLRTLSELEARLDAATEASARTREELEALGRALLARAPTRALASRLRAADLAAAQAELERYTRALRDNALDPRQLESLRAALEEARTRRDALLAQLARAAEDGRGNERSPAANGGEPGALPAASARTTADGAPLSASDARGASAQAAPPFESWDRSDERAAPGSTVPGSPPERALERLDRDLAGQSQATAHGQDAPAPREGPELDRAPGTAPAPADPAGAEPGRGPDRPGVPLAGSPETHARAGSTRELERLEHALDEVERALAARDSARAAGSLEQGQRELERLGRERAGAARAEALADQIAQLRDSLRRGPRSEREAPRAGSSDSASGAARAEAEATAEVPGGPSLRTPTGHEPEAGERTPTRIAATENAGRTRRELIRAAASGGTVDSDYATVHAEYAKHAERELGREAIPPGYRVQVRRYFQAIGPRPATSAAPGGGP